MFVGWSDDCGWSGDQVLFGLVLFDTDVGNGIRLFIGNLFDEVSPECDWNSTRVVRNGAAVQHGNKKAIFHDDFTNGIGMECEDSFYCGQLIFV